MSNVSLKHSKEKAGEHMKRSSLYPSAEKEDCFLDQCKKYHRLHVNEHK